jgi:hypothetical protein
MKETGRRFFSCCTLAASLALTVLSGAAAAFEGVYSITGNDLNTGKPYSGVGTIVKTGDIYRLTWTFGPQSTSGVGLADGDTLAVSVDNLVVLYKRRKDGVLVGRWTSQTATSTAPETFTPRKGD